MTDYTLNIGDLVVSDQSNVTYTCFGLGSCIGLFLHDRTTGISGGAHIMLPETLQTSTTFGKYYSVKSSVEELLSQFKSKGSTLLNLRAKLTGGANILSAGSSYSTGVRNAEGVLKYLIQNNVFIAASDTGGLLCRTAKYNCQSGEMLVRNPISKEYKIY
jgi:chemotaxis protein CheD